MKIVVAQTTNPIYDTQLLQNSRPLPDAKQGIHLYKHVRIGAGYLI